MITLYSYVGVDPHVVHISLFRRFLHYYKQSGIDRFVFDLQTNSSNEPRIADFTAMAGAFDALVRHKVYEPYSAGGNQRTYTDRFMRDFASPNQWCVMADADEFIEFPGGAKRFLAGCDAIGANLVVGNLLDRFSSEGALPQIGDESSLDDLFPVAYPLTRNVRKGWDRKIVAFKGSFTAIIGRHAVVEEGGSERDAVELVQKETQFLLRSDAIPIGSLRRNLRRVKWWLEPGRTGVNRWRGRLNVHHFAWDAGIIAKMEARLREPGCQYLHEVHSVLAFAHDRDRLRRLAPHLTQDARLGV